MEKILILINEMAPYLLLGFLIAGLMHAFIPQGLYSRYLAHRKFRSVALATLFGIPLPLCSCGVIPTAMSLRREGASKGATTAFLIATPQTGVDSIIATYSLMGVPFAIIRPIAALVTALLGGQLVNLTESRNAEIDHVLPRQWFLSNLIAQDCCHEHYGWFSIGCTILLMLLLANALMRYFIGRHSSKSTTIITEDMKRTFIINGMSCNHCRATAEKAILSVAGVTAASVDLATKLAVVEGTAPTEARTDKDWCD